VNLYSLPVGIEHNGMNQTVAQLLKETPLFLYKLEGLVTCSQHSTTVPYIAPNESFL